MKQDIGNDLLSDAVVSEAFDIDQILATRGVVLTEATLADTSIRAISFASPNHRPTIALNTSSRHYSSKRARRFTLAHELCKLATCALMERAVYASR